MALFRKLFYRKPPDGLLEICEKVYVFDCCFTADAWEEQNYKHYVGGIMAQLKEHYPDASILVFNFREGEVQSQIANALSEYDMTIMEYPRQYEGCPLLPMEMIHHFLRSSESWLSLGLQNLLLMHCEIGGWPVLAFLLAALLIYRKQYTGEHKTLDMVYKQAPRELLNLLSPLNPVPSQLRYLQYVSRRNIATEWPPLDRALTMDCVIIRMIPNFDGEGGCRPIFRIYGQDPFLVSDRAPKVLFSTPKKSRVVRHYKQAECELVKIDINCHIQGDVVLECISLHDDMEREEMMFRVMFNTAFIRSNILMLNRDEIDILWDAKDLFPKDFRAEVLFSEMDAATSIVPVDCSFFEEKDGLPVEAFAKVHEIFSSVDWLVPKGDTAVEVLQHLTLSNAVVEAYSHSEKLQEKKYSAALEYVAESPTELTPEKQSNFSPQLSPNADAGKKQAEPQYAPNKIDTVIFTKPKLIHPEEQYPPSSTSPPHQFSIAKILHASQTKQSESGVHQSHMAKAVSSLTETDTFLKTFYSTPTSPSLPTNDAGGGPGQPIFSPATLTPPLTPPLEDKIGVQGGVTPFPLWSTEMPSVSGSPLKNNATITPGLSLSSALSPKNCDKDIGDGHRKPTPPPSVASSAEDVIKATRVALPPPPPPIRSSSTVDVMKCTGIGSPPTTKSSDLNNMQSTGSGSPAPPPPPPPLHLCSPMMIDVTHKTAPHTPSPAPNLYTTPNKETLVATDCQTPPLLPPCASISPLTEHSSSRFGPSPPPPPPPLPPFTPPLINDLVTSPSPCASPSRNPLFTPSLINNLVTKPSPPVPPPPLVPPHKNLSVREGLPPPPPPPPLPHTSPLKEHLSSNVGPPPPPPPPPPLARPSVDSSATRSATPPPPPPPPMPPGGNSSVKEGPPPPPPPPLPPVGNSSIKGAPPVPPPPPLHFEQGGGPKNPSLMSPPPPPHNPTFLAKDLSPSTNSPSVPSAPPPPLNFNKGASVLPNSLSISSSRDNNLPGYPSPPPPSIPPPGTKGKSSLSRTVTSRNNQAKKLKPLHWLKLSRAVSGSLWAEAQRCEASKAPEIDISELESLFSAAVPNPDHGGSGRKSSSRASMGHKSEKVQLIEHRRAYNCEIMLSKVKIPLPDLLSSVLSLEDSALDVDQVDNLIKFCPTKEEMEMLKGYTGDKDKLGKCEQFFWELMQVPRIESKLRVFSFKIQFCSQVSDLRKSLNVVNSVADQIRGSAKLKRIMQTILSLGNALNQGTARGSAIGFRLDSLLKLTETRARNNKMTLMHYLCKVLADKLPELLDFWQDLASLEPASKIQLKFLAEEMQAISKGLEKVVQELTMSENDGPVSDNFRKALNEFLCFSEGEVRSLASLYSGVGRNVDALILYFGEDPSRCPFEQVISTLLNFVRMFKKAHEENCKQLEFEKKKAEKEASTEKRKINASEIDNGNLIQSRVSSIK